MTAEFLRRFFPETLGMVEREPRLSAMFRALYPAHMAETVCQEPHLSLNGVDLRWPAVAAAAALGAAATLPAALHTFRRHRQAWPWGAALLWYAFMCVGALLHHSLLPHSGDGRWPVAASYAADVIGTACFGVSVAVASLVKRDGDGDGDGDGGARFLWAAYVGVLAVYVVGPQWVREQLYLAPTLAAFLAAPVFVWRTWRRRPCLRVTAWAAAAAAGAAVAVLGAAGDRWLCVALGSNFGLLFWFFAGCHVAVLCLWRMALLVSVEETVHVKLQ